MPVIINEVEVLNPPQPQAAPAQPSAARPALTAADLRELHRELERRQRRLVAD